MDKLRLKEAYQIFNDVVKTQTYKPHLIRIAHEIIFSKDRYLTPLPQMKREIFSYFTNIFKESDLIIDEPKEKEDEEKPKKISPKRKRRTTLKKTIKKV